MQKDVEIHPFFLIFIILYYISRFISNISSTLQSNSKHIRSITFKCTGRLSLKLCIVPDGILHRLMKSPFDISLSINIFHSLLYDINFLSPSYLACSIYSINYFCYSVNSPIKLSKLIIINVFKRN